MLELDKVFGEYLPNSEEMVGGVKKRRRFQSEPALAVDTTIREDLPRLIETLVSNSGRDVKKYKIYGSVGQPNRTITFTPWVGILRRDITTSTERGYYVVLLFSQDMQRCFLSLNQGVTQYQKIFGAKIALKKISQVAHLAAQAMDVPAGYIVGAIDLSAETSLGKGYESAAIISRRYGAHDDVSEDQFRGDLSQLLELYDKLATKLGYNLLDHLDQLSSEDYQEAANEIATTETDKSLPPGSLPPPLKVVANGGTKYKRNPEMAAIAIRTAKYQCEVDPSHETFTSRKTKQPFVEAHHLIPMQQQDEFDVSLDVPENIVALCPGCHRRFHHARFGELKASLSQLFSVRDSALKSRNVVCELTGLLKIYKSDIDED